MKCIKMAAITAGASLVGAGGAQAASEFGYQFTLTPTSEFGYNAPRLGLENIGETAIRELEVVLGDTSYNFDAVTDVATGDGVITTVNRPDALNDGERTDELLVTYGSFDTGDSWSALVDFDADVERTAIGSIEDAREALFAEGSEGTITVTFEGGQVLSSVLPSDFGADDGDDGDGIRFGVEDSLYRFAQFSPAVDDGDGDDGNGDGGAVIPTPAAAVAGLSLLAAMGVRRRR